MNPSGSLTICVFVDAFGWQILQRNRFLEDELPVRAPLQTVLGYSSTCDPTILTGCMPRDHGHFSFYRYDPPASPFRRFGWLSLLPGPLAGRARVRRIISRLVGRSLKYTGYFQLYNMPFRYLPWFDYSEKRDLYQPGGINGGQPTIFDHLRSSGTPFYLSDWRESEEVNLAALHESMRGARPRFAYLYMASMDGVLHAEGTRAPSVARKIAWYDEKLRGVLDEARKLYAEVRMFVFSDHGMADVTETLDIQARLAGTGLIFGRDYAAMFDSTMARFWFLRDGARAGVEACLAGLSGGRMLSEAELAAYGCDFVGHRYGELFFVADPGVLLCPSFMGERPIAGMHGYAPEHEDSVAMIATNASDVRLPERLDGIYSLMRTEAGV